MTDKHKVIKALIKLQTAKATVDQETARQVLIDEGIYDKDGNLTPEYGGPEVVDLADKVARLEVIVTSLNRHSADLTLTISNLRERVFNLETRSNHNQWTWPPRAKTTEVTK